METYFKVKSHKNLYFYYKLTNGSCWVINTRNLIRKAKSLQVLEVKDLVLIDKAEFDGKYNEALELINNL